MGDNPGKYLQSWSMWEVAVRSYPVVKYLHVKALNLSTYELTAADVRSLLTNGIPATDVWAEDSTKRESGTKVHHANIRAAKVPYRQTNNWDQFIGVPDKITTDNQFQISNSTERTSSTSTARHQDSHQLRDQFIGVSDKITSENQFQINNSTERTSSTSTARHQDRHQLGSVYRSTRQDNVRQQVSNQQFNRENIFNFDGTRTGSPPAK
ncbi:uncharacterized protein LOC130828704 [Amaranthus tricolor]|uniref:uncharacterized protein LOC130828704 n=1 Tax=Amaranthus tricolor TaxID=29722 RepID=UPI00258B92E7|nr:uncharacterized protein LOC130828704 [Amaranthus tricolor]